MRVIRIFIENSINVYFTIRNLQSLYTSMENCDIMTKILLVSN